MLESTSCCGLGYWNGITKRDSEKILKKMVSAVVVDGARFLRSQVVFTDITVTNDGYAFDSGDAIERLIEENKLGTVTTSDFLNSNSMNTVRTYLWTINKQATYYYFRSIHWKKEGARTSRHNDRPYRPELGPEATKRQVTELEREVHTEDDDDMPF